MTTFPPKSRMPLMKFILVGPEDTKSRAVAAAAAAAFRHFLKKLAACNSLAENYTFVRDARALPESEQ